ncbi:MAG: 4Fe-4S cluster-binding domain-containing protein [Candidatus Aminicenantes bacterium]|nr:4Fe-4S cluster-binding domain-containing protein [Candidatus Aminicenantes bacterium]
MQFSDLTLYLTEECNFKCSYCYQTRGHNHLNTEEMVDFIHFLLPHLTETFHLNFYGGEPLLFFGLIQKAVLIAEVMGGDQGKTPRFGLTTNGSLLEDSIIHFLNEHHFSVTVSYDGLSQDGLRHPETGNLIKSHIEKIKKHTAIRLEVNSVFTPESVKTFAQSMKEMLEWGVGNFSFALDISHPWTDETISQLDEQLDSYREDLLTFTLKNVYIPLASFKSPVSKGFYRCTAGEKSLVLAPDGCVYGCFLFVDLFRTQIHTDLQDHFCLGNLNGFKRHFPDLEIKIAKTYGRLWMNTFHTQEMLCADCPELMVCKICPVESAFITQSLGKIPAMQCRIAKCLRKHKKMFWDALQEKAGLKYFELLQDSKSLLF